MRKRIVITTITLVVALIAATLSCAEPTLTIMVPMRDGVKLATDFYLPEGEEPWPAILVRTPYGKSGVEGFATQANQRARTCYCAAHTRIMMISGKSSIANA